MMLVIRLFDINFVRKFDGVKDENDCNPPGDPPSSSSPNSNTSPHRDEGIKGNRFHGDVSSRMRIMIPKRIVIATSMKRGMNITHQGRSNSPIILRTSNKP